MRASITMRTVDSRSHWCMAGCTGQVGQSRGMRAKGGVREEGETDGLQHQRTIPWRRPLRTTTLQTRSRRRSCSPRVRYRILHSRSDPGSSRFRRPRTGTRRTWAGRERTHPAEGQPEGHGTWKAGDGGRTMSGERCKGSEGTSVVGRGKGSWLLR